jgi:hypothetical protein
MAANVFYLTMSFLYLRLRDARARDAGGVLEAMKVAVLTTSYPREPGDPAGNSSRTPSSGAPRGVEWRWSRRRRSGTSGSPTALGRRQPAARAVARGLLPAMLELAGGAPRFADADLVHAHWLPAAPSR